jgi:general secretion pathway protein H
MTRRGRARTTVRGYTLIEVVAVLLVLALAAGVVAPSVGRSLDSLRARAGVAGVASFLRAAREQAITKDATYEVVVDGEGHALALQVGVVVRAMKRLPPALRIEVDGGMPPTIAFYPQGRSSGGHLRIAAPGPTLYLVTVEPMTGRVATRRVES